MPTPELQQTIDEMAAYIHREVAGGFADLESAGIVCRQNFTCCGNCGGAEIGDEIEQQRELGREICGYTFFHWQDTERAVEGNGLYLSYGSILHGEKAALAAGHQVAAA